MSVRNEVVIRGLDEHMGRRELRVALGIVFLTLILLVVLILLLR